MSFKQLLVDAICGVGFPCILLAEECVRVGLALSAGNQWNPAWEWNAKALAACTEDQLQELYQALCEKRLENRPAESELTSQIDLSQARMTHAS